MDASLILFEPVNPSSTPELDPSSWIPALHEAGYTLERASTIPELLTLLETQPTTPVLIADAAGVECLVDLPESRLSHFLVVGHSFAEVHEWLERGLTDFIVLPLISTLLRARIEVRRAVLRGEQDRRDVVRHAELQVIERDLAIGRDIQASFLPESLPNPSGWDLAAFFRPAREVAGDFYDGFELLNKRRVGIVMADVCDKGVPAAIFMALFRTLIRSGAQQNNSLSWTDPNSFTDDKIWLGGKGERRQALPRIGSSALMNAVSGTNNYMTENHLSTGYFVTLFFGIFEPSSGNLLYINGGHNPPVILRTDGTHQFLKPTGPAVGMIPGAQYRIGQEQLNPGDVLFTYTDGVPEAKDESGHFFGMQRMMDILLEKPITDSQDVVDRMRAALDTYIGQAPPFDDITMMAVLRQPLEESAETEVAEV